MKEMQPVTILLVEDDPGHAVLIEKNLKRANIVNTVIALDDGQKAVDFLFKQGAYGRDDHAAPLLILLDLDLPVLNGYQVLEIIKKDERTKNLPVIMLTTTDTPQDIERCYRLGCNVFVTKPVEYDCFSDAIRMLGLFISIVKIPGKG